VTGVTASAPGKIVLCGEYAVLCGAPAIVTAVDRRARVALRTLDGADSIVVAPGLGNGNVRFRREAPREYRWSAGRYRLVEEILEALDQPTLPSFALRLDTRDFRDRASGKKLGIGSSAALATALTSALVASQASTLDVRSVAAAAHRAYQSGTGSGVDIASSFTGGTLRFENGNQPSIRTVNWPAGLEYRVLWSGHPSSTQEKLRRLNSRDDGDETMIALVAAASRVAELWEGGAAESVMVGLRDYVVQLQRFSAAHKIGVFDAGHQELLAPAAARELVYKPCGAGGGDIGIVLGTNADELQAFCRYAHGAGFTDLELAVGARGVALGSQGTQ
jgi:phosphomevalonate kinase